MTDQIGNQRAAQKLLDGKLRIDTGEVPFDERIGGIYALADPRDPCRVRYVGSSLDVVERWKCHARGATPQYSDGPKRAWLTGLAAQGVTPIGYVLEHVMSLRGKGRRHSIERRWIRAFNVLGCADLNVQLTSKTQKTVSSQISAPYDWKRMYFEMRRDNLKLREEVAQHVQHDYNMHECCSGKPAAAYNTTQLGAIAQVVCCMCGGRVRLINPQDFA